MSIIKILPNPTSTSGVTKNDIADFCDWEMGDRLTFGRFNLIYGYNGAGKTTLSNLIQFKHRNIEFKEDYKSFVFNKNYIKENISAETIKSVDVKEILENKEKINFGENVLTESKINEKTEKTKNLVKALEKLTDYEKDLKLIFTKNAVKIKDEISSACDSSYNNYNHYQHYNIKDLKSKISFESECQFKTIDSNTKNRNISQIKNFLQRKNLERFKSDAADINCSDISQLLLDYSVGEKISELEENENLYRWVKEGLDSKIHQGAGDRCKFCNNKISDERWNQLKKHFNQTMEKIEKKIESIKRYKKILEDDIVFPENAVLSDKHTDDYESAKFDFLQEKTRQILAAKRTISILNSKNNQDSMPVEILSITFHLDSINAVIEKINRDVETETQNAVDKLVTGIEESIIADLFPEYNKIKEEIHNIFDQHGDIQHIQNEIARIKIEILQLEKSLEKPNVFCNYFNKGIKNYLGHEDFSLEPNKDKTSYILLRKSKPATMESLSEGEKTSFALLYFLFSLGKRDFKIKESVIVIDDPISSLDSIHLHTAFSFIKRRVEGVKQIFILTHNLNFAQRVIKWFSSNQEESSADNIKSTTQCLMLEKKISGNKHLFKIKKMPESIRHHCSLMCYLFKRLHNLSENKNPEPFDCINAPHELRQFLEIYVSIWQPSGSSSPENLKEIWKGILDKEIVSSVVSFCNCHTHASPVNEIGDEFSILTANDNEFLKKIFKAIEEHNPKFYKVLIESKN